MLALPGTLTLLALLTGGLLAAFAVRQRLVNRELSTKIHVADERLRLAMQAGRAVAWDWDVGSGRDVWFGDLKTMFGIAGDVFEGRVEDFHKRVHPDDREMVGKAVAEARHDRGMYRATFRVVREDGTLRWASATGRFHYAADGEPVRMLGIAEDITERKRLEDAQKESEARFQLMADTAPVLIWLAGPDKSRTYVNRPWLEFTGRTMEAEMGSGWTEGVHPEDLKHCVMTRSQAFDRRKPFRIEYRHRRHDGVYRWLLDSGVPRFTSDGAFAGYIGSCVDITEEKLAKEALSRLSRGLMESQESERIGIARELHDDLAQRMASLTIELADLAQTPSRPRQSADMRTRARELSDRAIELGKDLQAISQRLHSFKLEYLGIAAAADGFCRELAKQKQVVIDFSASGVAEDLPKEIALCLFRVLQEAMHNAVNHAGVTKFRVSLRGTRDDIQLDVVDRGAGFDPDAAMGSHGLGLTGMRERLRLVDGRIVIESRPGVGTTVRARVPLPVSQLIE